MHTHALLIHDTWQKIPALDTLLTQQKSITDQQQQQVISCLFIGAFDNLRYPICKDYAPYR